MIYHHTSLLAAFSLVLLLASPAVAKGTGDSGCSSSEECEGGVCVDRGSAGSYCSKTCTGGCPFQYTCEARSVGTVSVSVCVRAARAAIDPVRPPEKVKAMEEPAFSSLLEQVKKTGFDDQRRKVIETAAANNRFTASQLGRLVDALPFAEGRMAAIRAVAPKIVDKENAHAVLEHLKFASERDEAAKLLH
jgi:hypothetical protein